MEIRPQTPAHRSAGIPGLEFAEAHLADLADQLEQAKIEALLGISYDPDAYDTLILDYRAARSRVESLRRLATQLAAFAVPRPTTHPDLAA